MSPAGSSITNPPCHGSAIVAGPSRQEVDLPGGHKVPVSYTKLSPQPGDGGKPCAELETEL